MAFGAGATGPLGDFGTAGATALLPPPPHAAINGRRASSVNRSERKNLIDASRNV